MIKKYLIALTIICSLILTINATVLAYPQVSAQAAILIDVETGQILYKKNIHERRAPASTTKIMTGILAIENGNLSDKVTASKRAAYEGGSSIYLVPDETLTLEEMVYGLLLKSGNDAAVAIAEHIGGSVENFANLMNLKAREVGALHTTFKNPNGLPQEGHLTTAYDLAQIARYALQNPLFAKIVSTQKKRIEWPGHSWDRILTNTNKLLTRSDIVNGVKTGYTRAAGRCLVSSATKDGQQLVSVVLKSGAMWNESLALLNYGFNHYRKVEVIAKGEEIHQISIDEQDVKLKSAKEFNYVLPKGTSTKIKKVINVKDDITLPIKKGEKLGNIALYDEDDNLLDRIDLISDRYVEDSAVNNFWKKLSARIQIYF
ncbi:D-alanyl-D-alanine carboxypeptidase family protein [Orenia metallireducens]|jgi:D-alanyl-D-alanine carboxypeptidase (penicillin-binding protein 5/6)|uniref:D-alanyl-D-alanine carboxypeptidase family protein n=1 Tax=Orenia metallireducens TaxID=1413210 RepID=UPI000AEFC1F7|nr:D-alanyl-D-alanine carboxypeptidase family protein [Orenia metallireducens]